MIPEPLQQQTRQREEQLRELEEQRRQLEDYNRSLRAQEQMYRELLAARDATITQLSAKAEEQAALIAHLQRMLFGPTSERMTAEQAAELEQVKNDLDEQQSRPAPDSNKVLGDEDEDPTEGQEEKKFKGRPRKPRDIPVHLEVQTTVLEPSEPPCEHCGQMGDEVSREVSEVVDLIPAKLIVRRTVRIKRKCRCGCGGIAIASLPPQLLPGSKLGVGLAVHILLSKYDDHIALYTLERIFRERHNVFIPRQQMVQWIEHIAGLLRLLVDRMLERIIQGSYLQIDESPVRVLDPEVKGKAAKGYLWYYRGSRRRCRPHL